MTANSPRRPFRLRATMALLLGAVMSASAAFGSAAASEPAQPSAAPSSGNSDLPDWFNDSRVQGHIPMNPHSTAYKVKGERTMWWDNGTAVPYFNQVADAMDEMGASVYTRHVKSTDEDPWWESKAPPGPGGTSIFDGDRINKFTCGKGDAACSTRVPDNTDLALQALNDAKNHRLSPSDPRGTGMSMIAYYKQEFDARLAQDLPAAVCHKITSKGAETVTQAETINRPYKEGYGKLMDITQPQYALVVQRRLLELAAKGAKGFYFDSQIDPPGGCVSRSAISRLVKRPPSLAVPTTTSYTDETYRRWIAARSTQRAQTLMRWHDAVKAKYPDVVFIVSTTDMPTLGSLESASYEYAPPSDVLKSEYHSAVRLGAGANSIFSLKARSSKTDGPTARTVDPAPTYIRQSLGWAVQRDAVDGRPPHVWASATQPNTEHTLALTASLLANGAIANLGVGGQNLYPASSDKVLKIASIRRNITSLPSARKQASWESRRASFELGKPYSKLISNKRPARYAAVLHSQRLRNRIYAKPENQGVSEVKPLAQLWREVLLPTTGAYQAFMELGVPVGVVDDPHVTYKNLKPYRVLFIPGKLTDLSAGQQVHIKKWKERGNTLIENTGRTGAGNEIRLTWGTDSVNKLRVAQIKRYAVAKGLVGSAPVVVSGGPRAKVSTVYADPNNPANLGVAVTNDYSWVQLQAEFEDDTANRVNIPTPARPAAGVTVSVAYPESQARAATVRVTYSKATGAGAALAERTLDCFATPSPCSYDSGRLTVTLPAFRYLAYVSVTPQQ